MWSFQDVENIAFIGLSTAYSLSLPTSFLRALRVSAVYRSVILRVKQ